jgi:hypothetical protein
VLNPGLPSLPLSGDKKVSNCVSQFKSEITAPRTNTPLHRRKDLRMEIVIAGRELEIIQFKAVIL